MEVHVESLTLTPDTVSQKGGKQGREVDDDGGSVAVGTSPVKRLSKKKRGKPQVEAGGIAAGAGDQEGMMGRSF